MSRIATGRRIWWLAFDAGAMGLVVGGFLGAVLFLVIDTTPFASLDDPFQRLAPLLWTSLVCAGAGAYFAGYPTWHYFRVQLKRR